MAFLAFSIAANFGGFARMSVQEGRILGRIWLELDDGVEVVLNAGDVLIQNGTRHRWRNRGEDWPLMAVVIVGARP